MRKLRTAALALALVAGGMAVPSATRAEGGGGAITDPLLISKIEQARARLTEGSTEPTLPVEVVGSEAAARRAVVANGGTVTGGVQGLLVQARLPVSAIGSVAAASGVTDVRYPRRAGYVVPPGRPTRLETVPYGTGTPGEEVAITNADDWQAAGFNGSGVKVGIIDYFDLGLWYAPELGTLPDAGHTFCQDSVSPPPATESYCTSPHSFNSTGIEAIHGVAVAEIVRDMAPGAQLYLATVATASDLQAAITWLAQQGVTIVTRSLGAAYDGPGDGTGALDAVVDYASSLGLTWFNSAGNDAVDQYVRRTAGSTVNVDGGQYVDFSPDTTPGHTPDTWLRIDGWCPLLDGVRWANDWYLPANQRTDYSVELWEPQVDPTAYGDHWNPTTSQVRAIQVPSGSGAGHNVIDASQRLGAPPLEAADVQFCPGNYFGPFDGISYLRIRRNSATPVGATPDTVEVGMGYGLTELGYSNAAGSAAKPVVDSRNPSLVAVGAVDPAAGTSIGVYSSQGPTNDGRTKPDVSAPSGLTSYTYAHDGTANPDPVFRGTSAASPVAAGMAAILQGAGVAVPGRATAAAVEHFVTDLGEPGRDSVYGTGKVLLPAVPAPQPAATPAKYVPLPLPKRVVDSRPRSGDPSQTGPFAPGTIVDVDLSTAIDLTGVTAVAVNLTSADTTTTGYLQAYPTLQAPIGATSTLNISSAGQPRPNFAVVPVGVGGTISVYLDAGGQFILDLLGYYVGGQTTAVAAGRFVPLAVPERWMDTRSADPALLPATFGGARRRLAAGETVVVPRLAATALPGTGVGSLVVNVTAVDSSETGYLQAVPNATDVAAAQHSTVNYVPGSAAANNAIVPLGANGTMAVFSSSTANVIVDVVGYITDGSAAPAMLGLFQRITPVRAYDTRGPGVGPFATGEARSIGITGGAVPVGAAGVSANLTVDQPANGGYLKAYPNGEPWTSSLNFARGATVANGALLGLGPSGTLTLSMSQRGQVIVDLNGFFLPDTNPS